MEEEKILTPKSEESEKVGAVMVVGGGIGGMQASLDLANAGYKVYLIEETTAIGGRMAQLDKTFPTNDCSMCTISPKLIEVGKHLNIEVITNAEVESLQGEAGNFTASVLKKPRYVIDEKCNACGDCIAACPVEVLSEFDENLMPRKAIYKRYPQAIPNAMAISKANRAPCVLTCPTGVNVQGYVALISSGKFEEALKLIRERNPFPSVCGRVCHHPCEGECNRQELDEPIAINPLKRFAADYVRGLTVDERKIVEEKPVIDTAKPKVAIVGAGPAGLTCAQDLALLGYPVTVFEALDKPGGMMYVGIPSYRLPKEIMMEDIQRILDLGIELKTNARIGTDGMKLSNLKEKGYQAIFLAIGSHLSRSLPIEGVDLPGVLLGVDFLRDVNRGKEVTVGRKVLVIGGGNVAIDVALTALRQGAEQVELACLESRKEMPAHEWEIEDALEEGVKLNCSWGPKKIMGKDRKARGVELRRCTAVFDSEGRFSPAYDDTITTSISCDTVIIAIGQATDLSLIKDDTAVETGRGGTIKADEITLATTAPGIFAGGDVVTGPKSVVEAIYQGHEAAISIDRYVKGEDLKQEREKAKQEPAPVPEDRSFEKMPRVKTKKLNSEERRQNYREFNLPLNTEEAVAEAKRCMNCGVCSECLQCVIACGPQAVDHTMKEERAELKVGSVILAPGFEQFDPRLKGEYGYGRMKNVITSLEFERILSASGPYQGHVLRPSDQKAPGRVAWIQCVGSRDVTCDRDYCSSVCCMYATKEAIMAVDHVPGLKATIFYNDLRAFGKGFEAYCESAKKNYGVQFMRGIASTVKEIPKNHNVRIKYVLDDGTVQEEEFDLVVLSVGLNPSESTRVLAERMGVALNRFGFCSSGEFTPNETSRPGIYVAGAFEAPMDIPETVMGASSAAALSAGLLSGERGTLIKEKVYPPEREVGGEEPRIGVFVCRCGTNIARVVGVPDVVEYTKTLPNVIHAEENLYTCSTDTQQKIINAIDEHKLNRVVVASCTPRTHEPLFQDTLCEGGLNKYLFEMANIRDQCSWVHASFPEDATEKAKDLVRMAVARAGTLEPLKDMAFEVNQKGLVIGGGLSGMTAALSLAEQGFETCLVEKEAELGGNLRRIKSTLSGIQVEDRLKALIEQVEREEKITIYKQAEVIGFSGHVGKYKTTIAHNGKNIDLEHGAVIVATGGVEYQPTEYLYGQDSRVVTQREFEEKLHRGDITRGLVKEVVMIQCVGSREEGAMFCSRVCCSGAIKNALRLKELDPQISVTILFRDIRTYAFSELFYRKAREKGIMFVRFDLDRRPVAEKADGRIRVKAFDEVIGREIEFDPDYLVLSAGIRPNPLSEELATRLKVPLTVDGFYLEAHMKLRPLDFSNEGMYLCGLAHSPKLINESIAQARGAAARAATILSKKELLIGGMIAVVDKERCAACLTCVRECPFDVPVITEEGVAWIEPASCQGCGICASACPRKAIDLQNYKDSQVIAKCEALFDTIDAALGA